MRRKDGRYLRGFRGFHEAAGGGGDLDRNFAVRRADLVGGDDRAGDRVVVAAAVDGAGVPGDEE